jgi:methyl-accepting chemotaxis protein
VFNIVIIGGGRGGLAMLNLFHSVPEVSIVGMVDVSADAPGMVRAKSLGIPYIPIFRRL